MRFKYRQAVIIIKPGFYSGAQGIVVDVKQETPGKYVYGVDVSIGSYQRIVDIKEVHLVLK